MIGQYPATSLGSGAFGRGGFESPLPHNGEPQASGRWAQRPAYSPPPAPERQANVGSARAVDGRSAGVVHSPAQPARSRCPRLPCLHRWSPGAGLSEAGHVRSPERTSVARRSEAARQSAMPRTTPKLSPTDEPWDDGRTAAFPRVTVRRLRRKDQLMRGSAGPPTGPTGVPRHRILITRRAGGRRRPRRESASGLAGPRDRRCPARRSRQWHRRSQQSRR
jgi:hypothetical protein